ncbi:transposable element Tcb1 transposase [Trichonephila clavipes]|nr:transposable element Tcb1 transposase [Trichonephila clavipes]
MSRRKQRSAFDQVCEFDRGRIVAYRDCGLSFREIGSRVGRNQTTAMRICDRSMQEVWRHRGERMLNSCAMLRHTGPASGVVVWGGIGYHARTPLVRIAGTLNSQRYISEWHNSLLEGQGLCAQLSFRDLDAEVYEQIFQSDGQSNGKPPVFGSQASLEHVCRTTEG